MLQSCEHFWGAVQSADEHVLVRNQTNLRQEQLAGEIAVSTNAPCGYAFSLDVAHVFYLRRGMDAKYQSSKNRPQDHHLSALSCGRDNARATRLRDVDGTTEHRLNRARTSHVDQLYI